MVNNKEYFDRTNFTREFILEPSSQDGYLRRDDVKMFELLFEYMVDVYFYVKDSRRGLISCNTASLDLLNLRKVKDAIGTKEEDFFPRSVAESIRKDDENVLNKGESVLNRIELITNKYGELIWVNTNKMPIIGINKKVIGIIGITRSIVEQKQLPNRYKLFSNVIDYIRDNLDKPISVSDLANIVNLSKSQLTRKFKQEFALSPKAFIQRARLQAAAHLLRNEDCSISQVALQNGFTDQSYFTRQFKKFFGKTPKSYSQLWISDYKKT